MKNILGKRRVRLFSIIALVVVCALVISVYIFRAPLGWAVWKHAHAASFATAFNRTDPALFFEIGNYYYGGGAYDTARAEKYYREALALDPSLQGPHYQLARIYFVQSDFNRAETEIDKELELHPDFGRSHYVRGLIYGYSGQLLAAEKEFIAFLKWKPDSWAGNNDLAWIYFQEGKYSEAADTARAGLKVAPDNPWLLNSLGVALLNTGDKKGARAAFARALEVLNATTEADWGAAYPGNDPRVYAEGYTQMKASIGQNLQLL